MGVVAAAAAAIAGAISSAASAVAAAIGAVVSTVISAVSAAVSFIAETVSSIISGVVSAVGEVVEGITSVIADITGLSASAEAQTALELMTVELETDMCVIAGESTIFSQIVGAVETIYTSMATLYETLHISTVIRIHEIAYMVSEDYREMMQGVYREISELSDALGLGAQFLNLAFEDARTIILDVSSIAGKKYDLAQVTWLKEFHDFVKKFAEQAERYERRPDLVFLDLDRWLKKPAVDVKAGIMQEFFAEVEALVKTTKAVVDYVELLKRDFENFVKHLPGEIREEIEKHVKPVFETIDRFIKEEYRPAMETVDRVLEWYHRRFEDHKAKLSDLARRLRRPGDYLREIDRLPKAEREYQEEIVCDIATRALKREVEAFKQDMKRVEDRLARVREALKKEITPPPWYVKEVEVPQRPPLTRVEPRKTWFVGDY